ncbi:MAG: hypothetical protein KGI73_03075 [Patescibacteria group bacterium]|nr:hypothetical protein [Patescibacteria group bacterium]
MAKERNQESAPHRLLAAARQELSNARAKYVGAFRWRERLYSYPTILANEFGAKFKAFNEDVAIEKTDFLSRSLARKKETYERALDEYLMLYAHVYGSDKAERERIRQHSDTIVDQKRLFALHWIRSAVRGGVRGARWATKHESRTVRTLGYGALLAGGTYIAVHGTLSSVARTVSSLSTKYLVMGGGAAASWLSVKQGWRAAPESKGGSWREQAAKLANQKRLANGLGYLASFITGGVIYVDQADIMQALNFDYTNETLGHTLNRMYHWSLDKLMRLILNYSPETLPHVSHSAAAEMANPSVLSGTDVDAEGSVADYVARLYNEHAAERVALTERSHAIAAVLDRIRMASDALSHNKEAWISYKTFGSLGGGHNVPATLAHLNALVTEGAALQRDINQLSQVDAALHALSAHFAHDPNGLQEAKTAKDLSDLLDARYQIIAGTHHRYDAFTEEAQKVLSQAASMTGRNVSSPTTEALHALTTEHPKNVEAAVEDFVENRDALWLTAPYSPDALTAHMDLDGHVLSITLPGIDLSHIHSAADIARLSKEVDLFFGALRNFEAHLDRLPQFAACDSGGACSSHDQEILDTFGRIRMENEGVARDALNRLSFYLSDNADELLRSRATNGNFDPETVRRALAEYALQKLQATLADAKDSVLHMAVPAPTVANDNAPELLKKAS